MCISFILCPYCPCPCQHRYCPTVHWQWSQEQESRWPMVVCCVSVSTSGRVEPATDHWPPSLALRDSAWHVMTPVTLTAHSDTGVWSLHSWSWQYIWLFQNQDGHTLDKVCIALYGWTFHFNKKNESSHISKVWTILMTHTDGSSFSSFQLSVTMNTTIMNDPVVHSLLTLTPSSFNTSL